MPRGVYPRTEKHRQGIKNKFAKGMIPWNKGLKGWNNGHSVTQETRDKIKRAVTKQTPKSSLNQLIRKSSKFKLWRLGVFKRDNYTCQNCKQRSKKGRRLTLHPHHIYHLARIIQDYNLQTIIDAENCDILWDISNGESLCSDCHQLEHKSIKLSLTGEKAEKL